MKTKSYRIGDIQEMVDRDKTTLIRWEKDGLIPRAKRDSRGWRYYSKEDVNNIVNMVLSSQYFKKTPRGA